MKNKLLSIGSCLSGFGLCLFIMGYLIPVCADEPMPAWDKLKGSDFEKWKRLYGKKIDVDEWKEETTFSPRRRAASINANKRALSFFLFDIGPLALRVHSLDRSQAGHKKAIPLFPPALCDKNGLIVNALAVTQIQKGSPAKKYLQLGDFIIGIDGQTILSAQHTFLDVPWEYQNKLKRSLQIHTGELIDAAEGRGSVRLSILRIPPNKRKELLAKLGTTRNWTTLKTLNSNDGKISLSIPLVAKSPMVFRLKAIDLGNAEVDKSEKKRNKDKKGKKKKNKKDKENRGISYSANELALVSKDGRRIELHDLVERSKYLCDGIVELPVGEWTLTGELNSKSSVWSCHVETSYSKLPKNLQSYLMEVEFPIARLGSFGKTFDPNSPKVALYSKMIAYQLCQQQQEDGRWSPKGFGVDNIMTSFAVMGLLSTGDPKYHEAARRGVRFLSKCKTDGGAYVNGLSLMAMSEYMLRTKDKSFMPYLKRQVAHCRSLVFSDYTAGHGYEPGYSEKGWIGASSVIACGLALADKAGALSKSQQSVLDMMLVRAQQLGPDGKMPYGRFGKDFVYGKYLKCAPGPHGKGHAGSCKTGGMHVAALVRGGAPIFLKNGMNVYGHGPYGLADTGHAVEAIHLLFSSISTCNSSSKAHVENMTAFLWKFVLRRSIWGFVTLDHFRWAAGEKLCGTPFTPMGAYLILMNAHLKNLAITGDPRFQASRRQETPLVSARIISFYNHISESWAIVDALAHSALPPKFAELRKKLAMIQSGPGLNHRVIKLLQENVPTIVKEIQKSSWDPKIIEKGKIINMLLAIHLEADTVLLSTKPIPKPSRGSDLKEILIKRNISKKELDGLSPSELIALEKKSRKKIKRDIKAQNESIAAGEGKGKAEFLLSVTPMTTITKKGGVEFMEDRYICRSLFQYDKIHLEVSDKTAEILPTPLAGYLPKEFGRDGSIGTKATPTKFLTKKIQFQPKTNASVQVRMRYNFDGGIVDSHYDMPVPLICNSDFMTRLGTYTLRATLLRDGCRNHALLFRLDNGTVIDVEGCRVLGNGYVAGSYCEITLALHASWAYKLMGIRRIKESPLRISGMKLTKLSGPDPSSLIDDNDNSVIELEANSSMKFELQASKEGASLLRLQYEQLFKKHNIELLCEGWVGGRWKLISQGTGRMTYLPVIPSLTKYRITVNNAKKQPLLKISRLDLFKGSELIKIKKIF